MAALFQCFNSCLPLCSAHFSTKRYHQLHLLELSLTSEMNFFLWMYTRNFQCRLLANQSNAMWLFYYNLYALLKRQQTIAVIFKSSFLAAFKVDYSCLAVGRGLKNDFFRWMKLSNRLMTDIEMTIRALTSVLIPLLLSKFTKYMQIFSRQIMKTWLTW